MHIVHLDRDHVGIFELLVCTDLELQEIQGWKIKYTTNSLNSDSCYW